MMRLRGWQREALPLECVDGMHERERSAEQGDRHVGARGVLQSSRQALELELVERPHVRGAVGAEPLDEAREHVRQRGVGQLTLVGRENDQRHALDVRETARDARRPGRAAS